MDRNHDLNLDWIIKAVALRKESVDRNAGGFPTIKAMRGSLSARRAWIEILTYRWQRSGIVSRSPQGERG